MRKFSPFGRDDVSSDVRAVSSSACEPWPWSAMGGALFVVVAVLGLLMSAAPASAGDYDRDDFSFSIGYETGSRGRDRFRAGVTYRHSDRGWSDRRDRGYQRDRGFTRHRRVRRDDYGDRGFRRGVTVQRTYSATACAPPAPRYTPPPRGYWKQVWCPPVYQTTYDECGTARRVCIRAGYYKSVYVQASVSYDNY